jgi:hypothetical protein
MKQVGKLGQTASVVLALALAITAAAPVSAQTAAPAPASAAPKPPSAGAPHHRRAKPSSAQAQAQAQPEPAPAAVVAPPAPDWPVNAQAQIASVSWDGRQLSVTATNSSLQQILRDVSTATGVKVDGLGSDSRVFGNYGPAPARDVLSKLLEGSGYNLIMIGDTGQGTPRELRLTARGATATPAQPANNAQADQADNEPQEEPEQPEPPQPVMRHNNFQPPNAPGLTPQDRMLQMQQRQQQLLNQQQNGQQPQQPQ